MARIRALVEDPTVLVPEPVGDETPALARLRRTLERARAGGPLPFTARCDKGSLGALREAREVANQSGAPRLLDARVDGNRRFFLPRGHVQRLVCLGVQNHDEKSVVWFREISVRPAARQ